MNVCLRGSSPATMVAGILLLSRARTFGQRIRVEILGDPDDVGVVVGPAVLHSAALASCGVGRDLGSGALVVVPGPGADPLAVSLSAEGRGEWFLVSRSGTGAVPATAALYSVLAGNSPDARRLSRQLRLGMEALGCAFEPSVFDLLFGAPVAPLTRVAVALRAGRTLSGQRGAPVTAAFVAELAEDDELDPAAALARLAPPVRDVLASLRAHAAVLRERGDDSLACGVDELLGHFGMLPLHGILPLLDPVTDAVAVGLGRALGATSGNPQAQATLMDTYRFLGGKFTSQADWVVDLPASLPPEDRLGRWRWFASQVAEAASRVEKIWRDLVDPPM